MYCFIARSSKPIHSPGADCADSSGTPQHGFQYAPCDRPWLRWTGHEAKGPSPWRRIAHVGHWCDIRTGPGPSTPGHAPGLPRWSKRRGHQPVVAAIPDQSSRIGFQFITCIICGDFLGIRARKRAECSNIVSIHVPEKMYPKAVEITSISCLAALCRILPQGIQNLLSIGRPRSSRGRGTTLPENYQKTVK